MGFSAIDPLPIRALSKSGKRRLSHALPMWRSCAKTPWSSTPRTRPS